MASIIDRALAKSLIHEYQQQNASAGGPGLLTSDNHHLNGYFIDRQSLADVLSNPNVVGVSINFAKHPNFTGQTGNYFTLVFAGAEPAAAGAATTYVNTGNVYDNTPPCPTLCGDLDK